MITYELAKKLKDAGFPQKGKGSIWTRQIGPRDEDAYVPTLSKLIEACGDGFVYLEKYFDEWRCGEYEEGTPDMDSGEPGGGCFETKSEGKTPEEAVANLWLELHKKTN